MSQLEEELKALDREIEEILKNKDPICEILSALLMARTVLEDAFDHAQTALYRGALTHLMKDIDKVSELVRETENL